MTPIPVVFVSVWQFYSFHFTGLNIWFIVACRVGCKFALLHFQFKLNSHVFNTPHKKKNKTDIFLLSFIPLLLHQLQPSLCHIYDPQPPWRSIRYVAALARVHHVTNSGHHVPRSNQWVQWRSFSTHVSSECMSVHALRVPTTNNSLKYKWDVHQKCD